MTLNPRESAQVDDLDKQLRERGRRDKLFGFLVVIALVLSAGALSLGLARANQQADSAKTKAGSNSKRITRIERKVLPIQRVLVRKDILRDGPRGLTGGRGPLGRTGDAGVSGRSGLPGAQGLAGLLGADGPAGTDGTQGEPGATGEQGPQGEQGEQGPQGEVGPEGPPGTAVQSFTFTHLGITYVCTDPEQDGSYACQPSP